MRVLIVDPSNRGGNCHYSFALANGLVDHSSGVALLVKNKAYELEMFPRRFQLHKRFPGRPYVEPGFFSRILLRRPADLQKWLGDILIKEVRSFGADVVHWQVPLHQQFRQLTRSFIEPFLWKRLRDEVASLKGIVYTAHNILPHEAGAEDVKASRRVFHSANQVIVHGEMLADEAIQRLDVESGRLSVIPHGNYHYLADESPKWSKETARATLELTPHSRVVLFFGYIRHYKGLDVLLQAQHELMKRRPDLPLVVLVAGTTLAREPWDGSDYPKIIHALGLNDRVKTVTDFIPLEEMGRYFAAADLACFPYRSASQSGAIQLAYAYSKAVIASRIGGIPEAVAHGETGLLVKPEDPIELAKCLETLLDDPNRAEVMGRRARVWSGKKFDWAQISRETAKVYRAAIAGAYSNSRSQ